MSGMKKSVRSETAWAKWRGLVAAQEASGLSVHGFCDEHGIPASSMFAWRRKLRDAVFGAAARRPGFVEVVRERAVTGGERVDRGGRPHRGGRGSTLAIELDCGRRIVLERGFDRHLLLEVIEALECIDGASIDVANADGASVGGGGGGSAS
jgi:hypothetical protein